MEGLKKNKRGITLVALAITIVILIILAGISINLALGDNGIIAKAIEAKDKAEADRIAKDLNMKILEVQIISQKDGILSENIFNKLGVVGINRVDFGKDNDDYVMDKIYVVIENDEKYYHVTIDCRDDIPKFNNIQPINAVPVEAIVFYNTIFNKDTSLDELDRLNNGMYEYNTKTYRLVEDYTEEGFSKYVQVSKPLKMRINSGEDGHFEFSISYQGNYIDWGDGFCDTDEQHTYDSKNSEYLISIYGRIGEILAESNSQILSIEDWGNICELYGIHFKNCGNLETIASPKEQTFKHVEDFNFSFENCTSLQNIPEDFFENCPNVTGFIETFAGCINLTGNAPKLWERVQNGIENNYEGTPHGSGCFYNCSKLENYADIPFYWKNLPPS